MKRLFDVDWTPQIPFSAEEFPQVIRDIAVGKMSLSGVQPKASIVLNQKTKYIEIAQGNGTHILKPTPAEYPELAEIEDLCMSLAEHLEMDVPPHAVLPMADGVSAYVVKRFDRLPDGSKLHKEDMAQLLELPSTAKYEASLEKVGKAIRRWCSHAFLDLINFYERVLFNFVIGNGDMHLKNWALLTLPQPEGRFIRLAPCYDFVSSRLYIPNDDESALTIHGRRNRIQRSDFEALAHYLELDAKAAASAMEKIVSSEKQLLEGVKPAPLSAPRKEALLTLISSRIHRLRG